MTILTTPSWRASTSRSADVSTASTLPADLYTSPDVLQFEWEAVFAHEWLCAGRVERIPNPGDWFTVTLRQRADHRGPRQGGRDQRDVGGVPAPGDAGVRRVRHLHDVQVPVPPLDLQPRRPPARRAGDGAHRPTSTSPQFGLPRLRVELWQGFVFVNMDPGAAPLGADASPVRAVPRATTTSTDAVCPGTFTLTDLPWNWKVMFENFNDGYHANRLHQYVQDFCPSGMTRVPGRLGRGVQRDLPHRRLHPPRRRLQRRPTTRSCRSSRS